MARPAATAVLGQSESGPVITGVTVENFKSIEKLSLDFGRSTVLVGPPLIRLPAA